MRVKLDKDGYFTGSYAEIGNFDGSIEIDTLPPNVKNGNQFEILSYKYLGDDKWVFDEKRYQYLVKNSEMEELIFIKTKKIKQSKDNLANFLNNSKVISSCHGGVKKEYSVTAEKQQYLNNMIAVTKIGLQSSDNYRGSWNASGEESTCDWTLDELQRLAIEIEEFVRPFILKQQQIEIMINNSVTLEELENIDISFK